LSHAIYVGGVDVKVKRGKEERVQEERVSRFSLEIRVPGKADLPENRS
jgi:hypothetical protein